MNAVAAAYQRAVNIEQVGCLRIPGEPLLNSYTVWLDGWSGQHDVGLAPPASAPAYPWRKPWRKALNTGRSLRTGRLSSVRTSERSRPSSAIARLNVLRCIP